MPDWEAHRSFVASRPYLAWYLIDDEGVKCGAVYITKNREVGIAVLRAQRGMGLATAAIKELMRLHPGNFLAHINPANEKSVELFGKLGFIPQQLTMEKP